MTAELLAFKLMYIALFKCTLTSDNVEAVWRCQEAIVKEYQKETFCENNDCTK